MHPLGNISSINTSHCVGTAVVVVAKAHSAGSSLIRSTDILGTSIPSRFLLQRLRTATVLRKSPSLTIKQRISAAIAQLADQNMSARVRAARTLARNLRPSSPRSSAPPRARTHTTAASEEGALHGRGIRPTRARRTLVPAAALAMQLRSAPTALELFIRSWNEFDDT